MPLESILGPQVTSLIAYSTAILTAFSLLYGFAKIAWARMSGRAFPDNRITRGLDALAELGSNLVGFANKVKRGDGAPLIPNPEVVARDATIAELRAALDRAAGSLPSLDAHSRADEVALPRPAAPDAITALRSRTLTGREGFDATARQELAPDVVAAARREGERGSVDVRALVALALLMALMAACPNWNRAACPVPGAYSCVRDQPHYCARATHELTPIGDEPCSAQGRVCALSDAGVARCALATDGGAR